MNDKVTAAALVAHPKAALDPAGIKGVYRYAVTSSVQNLVIPAVFQGHFLKLTVVSPAGTTSVQYGLSKASQAIVLNQLSNLGTGHASAGGTILPNSSADGRIDAGMGYLNFIGSATETSCFLEIYVSDVPA